MAVFMEGKCWVFFSMSVVKYCVQHKKKTLWNKELIVQCILVWPALLLFLSVNSEDLYI